MAKTRPKMAKLRPKMPKTRPQDGEDAAKDGPKEAQEPWDKKIKNVIPDSCNAITKTRPKRPLARYFAPPLACMYICILGLL